MVLRGSKQGVVQCVSKKKMQKLFKKLEEVEVAKLCLICTHKEEDLGTLYSVEVPSKQVTIPNSNLDRLLQQYEDLSAEP